MTSYVGIPNGNPTKYLGPNVALVSIVTRNRSPTGADIRQGTTGQYYPIGSFWIVSKNPTTGTEGDMWWLSKIEANVAYWIQVAEGASALLEIDTPSGTAIPVNGILNFLNGTGMNISATGNSITFAITGAFANTYTCDSGSAVPSSNILIVTGAPTGLTTLGSGNTLSLAGTLNTAHGGTSANSFTVNGAVISSTTSTGPLTAVALTSQKFLVGNPSGAPTAKSLSVHNQIFTSNGTYTPTAGMVYCQIQVLGGGGAGGGGPATSAIQCAAGGGGGAGEYAVGIFSSTSIGASKAVTIGAAGVGASNASGGDGGNTSVGALISAFGGQGGNVGGVTATCEATDGGDGGTGGSGGDYRSPGAPGSLGFGILISPGFVTAGGIGASSQLGSGGIPQVGAGFPGSGYGAGGGGASNIPSTGSSTAGGNGSSGVVVVTEYILS